MFTNSITYVATSNTPTPTTLNIEEMDKKPTARGVKRSNMDAGAASPSNSRKASKMSCLFDKLNDSSLRRVVEFSASDAQTVASLRIVNKCFLSVTDAALFWIDNQDTSAASNGETSRTNMPHGIIQNISVRNGHANLEWRAEIATMECLCLYERAVAAGLFKKIPVPGYDGSVPLSVARVLKLKNLFESFPTAKADYERDGDDGNDSKNIVSTIFKYMIQTEILPSPSRIDLREHVDINMFFGRNKYRHPIYHEYLGAVPANVHHSQALLNELLPKTPLHLLFLIASGNRNARW